MVKQAKISSKPASSAGKKRSGADPRKRSGVMGQSGLKPNPDFSNSAKRILAFRRFWLFLLAAVLVLIGLASVVGARFQLF